MELKIKIEESISEEHTKRVLEVIKTSVLKQKPNDWTVIEFDQRMCRVYLLNNELNKQFSILFEEVDSGYNYCIHEKMPINDRSGDSLTETPRRFIGFERAGIEVFVQIAEGFKKNILSKR